jgi:predicted esterase
MPCTPECLIILLHGVGSSGANLAPLGEVLQSYLPDAASSRPTRRIRSTAATRAAMVQRRRRQRRRPERVVGARAGFDRVVAGEIERAGFAGRLDCGALFGFSQGAILSLDALVDGRWPVAAVVVASGRLASPIEPAPASARPCSSSTAKRTTSSPPQKLRGRSACSRLRVSPSKRMSIPASTTACRPKACAPPARFSRAGSVGSKYPPAKPGALGCEPLKAVDGSLTRPVELGAA